MTHGPERISSSTLYTRRAWTRGKVLSSSPYNHDSELFQDIHCPSPESTNRQPRRRPRMHNVLMKEALWGLGEIWHWTPSPRARCDLQTWPQSTSIPRPNVYLHLITDCTFEINHRQSRGFTYLFWSCSIYIVCHLASSH